MCRILTILLMYSIQLSQNSKLFRCAAPPAGGGRITPGGRIGGIAPRPMPGGIPCIMPGGGPIIGPPGPGRPAICGGAATWPPLPTGAISDLG